MTTLLKVVVACAVLGQFPLSAQNRNHFIDEHGHVSVQDMKIRVPDGWTLHQDAFSDNTLILGFAKGDDYVTFYVNPNIAVDMKAIFGFDAQISKDVTPEMHGPFTWKVMETSKTLKRGVTHFVKAFMSQYNGKVYYGYGRASSAVAAASNVDAFLSGVAIPLSSGRSLTAIDYKGKKYYFGWGAAGFGDPSMMHNEVKYDVLHTHDIFTKEVGGNYLGTQLVGTSTTSSKIKAEWQRLKGLLTVDDMYVQYSSGHGSQTGLGVGVKYSEIRDNALSYPAKEIIIYTMACYSGNMVDSFNAKKSEWQDWQSKGRTLMVMASSKGIETSSTGPGTDSDEAGGPNGSAGSAFGHALWKSLIGYADGYVDGVKDGYLSLGEIRDYTVWKTQQVGDHTPVHTGAYNPSLIMNKKPSKAFLASIEAGTEGLTDTEIMERIQELDRSMRIH